MNIKNLSLTSFRSYKSANIDFSGGTNIIYGNNAAGKTNILESIFLFCTGRSHRGATDSEIISNGSDYAVIRMNFCDDIRDYSGIMTIQSGKKKGININDISIAKLSQIADYINVVMFSPEDLAIIKDSPQERRKFLNMAICQLRPAYASMMGEYSKVINQRNNLLRSIKKSNSGYETLFVWNEKLADLSSKITYIRLDFIDNLLPYLTKIHKEITGEDILVKYNLSYLKNEEYKKDVEFLKSSLLEKLEKSQARDIELGSTGYGAHRDDLSFYINGCDAKIYGSQGQQRSVVLSLKLAQTEIIADQKNGAYPVILLDDIMSELDENRRKYLVGKIKDKQVIITCTDKETPHIGGKVKYFKVENGVIT